MTKSAFTPSIKTVPPALEFYYIFMIKSQSVGSTMGLNFRDKGQTGVSIKLSSFL